MIPRLCSAGLVAIGLIASQAEAAQSVPAGNPQRSAMGQVDRPSCLDLPLELVASTEDPGELHQMGAALEVEGDYLFVGAPGDGSGRVDVWYRKPSGYMIVQQLFPPAPIAGDGQFGRSLAADGGVLVVGTLSGNNSGHAAVYRRGGNGRYSFEQTLAPAGGHVDFSFFAERLSVLEGEVVAVAAKGELAVHLFEAHPNGQFPATSTRVLNQVNTVTAPSMSWMTGFGSTVNLHRASSGTVSVLVGMHDACFYQATQEQAPDEVTQDEFGATAARTGGVAVVQETAGTWQLDHRLIPDWSRMKDFGFEVDVDGSHVAVGALYSDVFSGGRNAGTASVYRWNGSRFRLVETIWPSLPEQNGWFGYSLAVCADHLLVGQPHLWGGPQGVVEVFRITAGGLVRAGIVQAPDGNPAADPGSLGDSFGRAVVQNSHGEVVVAAPFSAPDSGTPPLYAGGALYLYR